MKIKSFVMAACAVLAAVCLAGCLSATQSTIKEFDASGNLTKETVTSESVVKNLVESTKNKTVIMWESGWMAYMAASTATTEDPTPTVKMFAGKADKGVISAMPNQQDWNGIADVIRATKSDLAVSVTGMKSTTGGVENNNSEVSKMEEKENGK